MSYFPVIHVSCLETARVRVRSSAFLPLLSMEELRTRSRFVLTGDAREYVLARMLLRVTKSQHERRNADLWPFGPSIAETSLRQEFGQPIYNLAHAHGIVVCAVTRLWDSAIGAASLDEVNADADEPSDGGLSNVERLALQRAIDVPWLANVSPTTFALSPAGSLVFAPGPELRFAPSEFEFALFAPTSHHRVAVAVPGRIFSSLSVVARRADDWRHIPLLAATEHVLAR